MKRHVAGDQNDSDDERDEDHGHHSSRKKKRKLTASSSSRKTKKKKAKTLQARIREEEAHESVPMPNHDEIIALVKPYLIPDLARIVANYYTTENTELIMLPANISWLSGRFVKRIYVTQQFFNEQGGAGILYSTTLNGQPSAQLCYTPLPLCRRSKPTQDSVTESATENKVLFTWSTKARRRSICYTMVTGFYKPSLFRLWAYSERTAVFKHIWPSRKLSGRGRGFYAETSSRIIHACTLDGSWMVACNPGSPLEPFVILDTRIVSKPAVVYHHTKMRQEVLKVSSMAVDWNPVTKDMLVAWWTPSRILYLQEWKLGASEGANLIRCFHKQVEMPPDHEAFPFISSTKLAVSIDSAGALLVELGKVRHDNQSDERVSHILFS